MLSRMATTLPWIVQGAAIGYRLGIAGSIVGEVERLRGGCAFLALGDHGGHNHLAQTAAVVDIAVG